ncbi:hypothetical protein CCR90_13540 [Rhodovulum sulfidophilum]|uniref:terminase small subunit n=1 Tax=Rhodovulum sulfidophilum TaxID=35806 RepID=UPI0019140C95|nr:terminase small subunit [Rhodovulum sulfidophilum]MBK5924772.1 hypothetical protein [Rhodovulum sulfidophilum]
MTDLAELRRLYPLPEGVEDTAMNRAQIARALDVSDNTISKWIAQGMPVLEEGGNGREYAFSPADCYAWRRHRDAEARAAKAAADRSASQLAMAFRNLDEEDANASPPRPARSRGGSARPSRAAGPESSPRLRAGARRCCSTASPRSLRQQVLRRHH